MKNEKLLNKQHVLFANRIVFKKLLISLTLVVNVINYLIGKQNSIRNQLLIQISTDVRSRSQTNWSERLQ